MAEYEFSHITKAERVKIIAAKVLLGLMIAFEFYSLVLTDGDLASRVSTVGTIFIFIFAYINLLCVKSEFAQLFEPPYFNHGLEFAVGFAVLKVLSWFL